MRILVTGGAGFIGSHLVERLVDDGHTVAVVDSLVDGRRDRVGDGVGFYEIDIRDADALEAAFASFRPEAVAHLAAHASVGRSVREPAYDADVNIVGLVRIIDACRGHGVDRLVFASSGGAVYGEVDGPAREDRPLTPKSPYGMSKLAGESYARFFAEITGGTAVVLRYANVYGPRQDASGEGGVVSIFAERLLRGEIPTIFGDGEQQRDFIFVGDVVDATARSLTAEVPAGVHVCNVGTGVARTVNRTAARIVVAVGAVPTADGTPRTVRAPIHGPERPGDLRTNVVDPARITAMLGWRPKTDFDSGIETTVAWFGRTIEPPS